MEHVDRTRSEYRLAHIDTALASPRGVDPDGPMQVRPVSLDDRDVMALFLLDAYRGTIDDEGETLDDSFVAVDVWFAAIQWPHSFVLERDGELIAASFVVAHEGAHYIDPVLTRASEKGHGLGTAMVMVSLRSLAADGVTEVGATITDGNVPSERLFARLGFVRTGAWT